jgi:hypothetical protein
MPCSENPLRRLHFIISRGSLKNGKIAVLKDKPIRLIKWPEARLQTLLISPYLKRRIRKLAMRDYRRG